MKFSQIIPILRSFDEGKALERPPVTGRST
jgi:hypothetical protein